MIARPIEERAMTNRNGCRAGIELCKKEYARDEKFARGDMSRNGLYSHGFRKSRENPSAENPHPRQIPALEDTSQPLETSSRDSSHLQLERSVRTPKNNKTANQPHNARTSVSLQEAPVDQKLFQHNDERTQHR